MAVRFRRLFPASAVVLIGGLALSACGQAETEAPAAAAEVAPLSPAAVAAALAPDALMLRAVECRMALAPLRLGSDRVPPDLTARVARTADIPFRDLVFGAKGFGLAMEDISRAHSSGRPVPRSAEEVTADYVEYVETCAEVMDRAAPMLNEAKAAKP